MNELVLVLVYFELLLISYCNQQSMHIKISASLHKCGDNSKSKSQSVFHHYGRFCNKLSKLSLTRSCPPTDLQAQKWFESPINIIFSTEYLQKCCIKYPDNVCIIKVLDRCTEQCIVSTWCQLVTVGTCTPQVFYFSTFYFFHLL